MSDLDDDLERQWRRLFDSLDSEGFGEVPICSLKHLLMDQPVELLDLNAAQLHTRLLDMERHGCQLIDYQEFVNIVTRKRRLSFKCAVHSRDRQIQAPDDFILLPQAKRSRKRELLPKHVLASQDEFNYFVLAKKKLRLPFTITALILIESVLFLFFMDASREVLDFLPCYKEELWRYVTYVFVHVDAEMLVTNLLAQILVGLPIELIFGSYRILCLCIPSVLGGSLLAHALDCEATLIGSDSLTLSLAAALSSYWTLKGSFDKTRWLQLMFIMTFISTQMGIAIYKRCVLRYHNPISFCGHLSAIVTGILMGNVFLGHMDHMPLVHSKRTLCILIVYLVSFGSLLIFILVRDKDTLMKNIKIIQPDPANS